MWLITAINLIGLLYLISEVNNLKNKIGADSHKPKAIPTPVPQPPSPAVFIDKNIPSEKPDDDVLVRFSVWFARDWPLKVGAIFILLGFVWLVTYAFLNNWIGPTGRIVFGIMAGSAILAWGSDRVKKNVYQGEIIMALGAGVVLLSIYAAQYVYAAMFPPVVALLLVALVSIAVGYIAYTCNTVRLATLGLFVGSAAPLLTASESKEPFGLFSYLFFVIIGTAWLVRKKGWRILTTASIFIVWIYSAFWFSAYLSPSELITVRFFAVTFSILFYLLSLGGYLYDRSGNKVDAYVGVASGLYALHWVLTLISEANRSLVCVAIAILFMLGALSIFKKYQERYPVYLFTAVSILFLITATFIELEQPVLSIALSIEALSLIMFADRVYGKGSHKYMAAIFSLPILMSVPYFTDWYVRPETFAMMLICATLYAAGIYLYKFAISSDQTSISTAKILLVMASVYVMGFIWRHADYYIAGQYPFAARAIVLSIYALTGISLYISGSHNNMYWTRRFGLYVTLLVIARLLLYEVWSMSLGPRIVTFFTIGIIFIISVFVKKNTNEKNSL